jgi:hypothetical protein
MIRCSALRGVSYLSFSALKSLGGGKGLLKVVDDVVDVFRADGDPDEILEKGLLVVLTTNVRAEFTSVTPLAILSSWLNCSCVVRYG